jgi:hypothetical protein
VCQTTLLGVRARGASLGFRGSGFGRVVQV